MKAVAEGDRQVANIRTGTFAPFVNDDGQTDGEVLQVNGGRTGYGFHVYRMAPGQTTIAHRHLGDEEFLLIEGDLRDHDGYVYQPGDLAYFRMLLRISGQERVPAHLQGLDSTIDRGIGRGSHHCDARAAQLLLQFFLAVHHFPQLQLRALEVFPGL